MNTNSFSQKTQNHASNNIYSMLATMPQPGDSYADAAKRRPQLPPKSVDVGMRNPLLPPRLQGSQKDRTENFLERNERWYRKTALCDKYSVPGENASAHRRTSRPVAASLPTYYICCLMHDFVFLEKMSWYSFLLKLP